MTTPKIADIAWISTAIWDWVKSCPEPSNMESEAAQTLLARAIYRALQDEIYRAAVEKDGRA